MLKPLDVKLDILNPEFRRDPRPTVARTHARGEIVPVKMPIFGEKLLAVSHGAVTEMLKDRHRFVQNPKNAGVTWLVQLQRWMPRTMRAVSNSMITQDDPEHRRLRGLVDQAFSRRGVEGLRGRIGEIADRLLDRMGEAPEPDLVEHFARRLPLMVIAELLGLPEEHHDKLHIWAQGFTKGSTLWSLAMTVPRIGRMGKYLRGQIAQARRAPRPGLLGELIRADADGDRLNDEELLAMVFLLFFAGHETTTHLVSVGTLTLLQNPETLARLREDLTLWPRAVEELLRHCSVVEMTKPRYVAEPGEFHGQELKYGQMIFAWLVSANYDPEVFDDPDRLNIDRDPNPHLAFGTGVHFCLGHQLARLEAQIAFERLFSRYPKLALAVPIAELSWKVNLGLRGLNAMPLKLAG